MTIGPMDQFSQLIAQELRRVAIQHIDLLQRKHFVAKCLGSLQERLAALDDSGRELVRECVVSSIETGIDAFLQALQESDASIKFPSTGEVALSEVDDLVGRVFRSFVEAD